MFTGDGFLLIWCFDGQSEIVLLLTNICEIKCGFINWLSCQRKCLNKHGFTFQIHILVDHLISHPYKHFISNLVFEVKCFICSYNHWLGICGRTTVQCLQTQDFIHYYILIKKKTFVLHTLQVEWWKCKFSKSVYFLQLKWWSQFEFLFISTWVKACCAIIHT